jgi:hypothetical protein
MNQKQLFQFGAAAALLLSGLVVARAAYACPGCDILNEGAANWGQCASIKCFTGQVCAQACGSGTVLYAALQNQSTFGNGVTKACIDAFAYTGGQLDGQVEETAFGTSTTNSNVTGQPATVLGVVYTCR